VAGAISPAPSAGLVIARLGNSFTMMLTLFVDLSPIVSVRIAESV
jgi:hypothetical protein